MECPVCFEQFNEGQRRPKLLLCGHTYCLRCLQQLEARSQDGIRCPTCNKQGNVRNVKLLPDNFIIFSIGNAQPAHRQDSPAPKDSKSEEAERRLRELEQRVEALVAQQELLDELQGVVRSSSERCARQLGEALDCMDTLRAGGTVPALRDSKGSGSRQEGDDRALRLLREPSEVSISSDTWRAEGVQLQQEPALRLCLLGLQQEGQLRPPPPPSPAPPREPQPERSPTREPDSPVSEFRQRIQELRQLHLSSTSLQPQRAQSPQEYPQPHSDSILVTENVRHLLHSEKNDFLERDVHVVRGLDCRSDPNWALQLLQRQAPVLQELELDYGSQSHLQALQWMPRLRDLSVFECSLDQRAWPQSMFFSFPGWQGEGLQRLAACLPKDTLVSLLRLQRRSLVLLELHVGTPPAPGKQERWPVTCRNLPDLLEDLEPPRLRGLILKRFNTHSTARCADQLADLRHVLPRCFVVCEDCADDWEDDGEE